MSNMIFGIGLPKTGTFSLCFAMKILGFRSLHYIEPNDFDYYKNVIAKYDFVNDCPINYIFENLSKYFVDSKFICTTRSYDSWIRSSKVFFKKKRNDHSTVHMINLFGSEVFEEKKFQKTYQQHSDRVLSFSKEKSVLHLPLEASCNGKWDLICNFLNIKMNKNQKYPWINKMKGKLL